jgi:hypothetical protein
MSDKITSNEKLEFLYYKSQNLAITDLDANLQKDIFLENKNYIFSESILAESIPSIEDITANTTPSTFKLSQNDLFNYQDSISLKKDSNNIVLKVTQLKLQKIQNSDTGWYYLDASKNNFLTPLIPPNYKSTDNGSNTPYQVKIYSEKGLERVKNNTAILTNELLRSCDYIFDYENGILLLAKECKDANGELISTENPPYISFYKYIGARGKGKGNTLDGQWLKDNSDIYYDSGAVIIGNNTKISSGQNKYNLEISGNVYISNNLCVKGDQIVRDDLHVIDAMDISGNLTVEGKSFFKDDVSGNDATFNKVTIDGDFKVEGKTTIKDISGADASFNNIDIDGNLTVEGKSFFKDDVSGNDATFNKVTIDGDFKVDGKTTIKDISGADASFNNIVIDGYLTVEGKSFFKDVSGNDASFNDIYISGNIFKDGEEFSSGAIIEISGNEADVDLNQNESKIFYDTSKNLFIGGIRQYPDEPSRTQNPVIIEPLGYSFFRQNLEGQPPAPSFFFFSITPSSIQINWTNPKQYTTGVTGPKGSSMPLDENSPIVTEPSSTTGGQIWFPVVNRIMIQIKNLNNSTYEYWGKKLSPITSESDGNAGVNGIQHGRVICSKNYPIPPLLSGTNPSFLGSTSIAQGRSEKIFKLENFANSIILYAENSTPQNSNLPISDNKLVIGNKNDSSSTEIPKIINSNKGYEIKIWLENEYNSGSMTESDFNVVTLNSNTDGTPINFASADPPSNDASNNASIKFNNMITTTGVPSGSVHSVGVSNAKTFVQLEIKDPLYTAKENINLNNSVNLIGIKFEIAYYNAGETKTIEKITSLYLSSDLKNANNSFTSPTTLTQNNLNEGIYSINRLRDSHSRYYYIALDNSKSKTNIEFKISYKNSANDNFSVQDQISFININKPVTPILKSVRMTSYNIFTITLSKFSDEEDIIGDATNIINNNMGVFLKNIKFNVEYQYGQGQKNNIPNFTKISGGESSFTTKQSVSVLINTKTFSDSTYTYELPAGLFQSNSTNTNPITYYFSASVQNNLISRYSSVSDQQSIQITNPSPILNLTLTPETTGTNTNNKIKADWSPPDNGKRGIISEKTDNGLPKIQKYTLESPNLKSNSNEEIKYDSTIITSSYRNEDPNSNYMFNFYDTLKYTRNPSTTKYLKLTIRDYNEYVNDFSDNSIEISATATKPELVPINNHSHLLISNTTSKNTVTLNWDHPDNRGLTIDGINIRHQTILTYRINIKRHSTTNEYLIGNNNQTDISYNTTTSQIDNTNTKTGTTDAPNTKILTSNDNESLLWPNSTYNYTITATNSLGYESDLQDPVKSFTTGTPTIPSAFNYFNDNRLDSLHLSSTVITDLNGNNNYGNLGVLISGGISSSTTYSGTAVQITNYNYLSDISSSTVTHVLNKKSLQTFLTNTNVQLWSDSVPIDANQAGFKIVNAAASDTVLYTIGMSTDYQTETDDDTLFEITRSNRKDIYSETYDDRNRGYWLKESIQYKINLAIKNNLSDYLYEPLKFVLKSYYNETGSDTSISTAETGKTVILENSHSSNSGNIYLDILDNDPIIGKNSTNDMITYTPSNQINGIPNLARGGTIVLKYKLSNYSQYYLLNSSDNVVEHYFSYAPSTINSAISWVSEDGGTRNSNNWIVDKTLSSIPSTTTATSAITIKIRARNTKGISDLTIGSIHSEIFNFIYDKPSSDEYTNISDSLRDVPTSFNPIYNANDSNDQSTYSPSSSYNLEVNTEQLSLWNGYFYGSYDWRNATNINTANCANYGIPDSLPVFTLAANDNNYKWVIFKYSSPSSATQFNSYNYYTVITKFSNSDFTLSNVQNDDIVVFFYNRNLSTTGNNGKKYYWVNISGNGTYGASAASNATINLYAGTLGVSYQFDNGSNFELETYSKNGVTGPRILAGWLNKSSIPQGSTANFYVAVGIKNKTTTTIKLKKPEVTLAENNVVLQTLD